MDRKQIIAESGSEDGGHRALEITKSRFHYPDFTSELEKGGYFDGKLESDA